MDSLTSIEKMGRGNEIKSIIITLTTIIELCIIILIRS